MASAKRVSREAYEDLCRLIQHWNENRLELFEISVPNENLDFEGIMRFYFQNSSSAKGSDTEKVATKCIRVSNSATTEVVIRALVQKFRPDMRMLSSHSYALYEVHANQDERRLEANENPLLVQLGWSRDDRDGRFLLRSETHSKSSQKSEKKVQKKRVARRGKKTSKKERIEVEGSKDEEDGGGRIARSLYNMMPESRFTRSISVKNRRNLLSRQSPDKLLRKDSTTRNELKIFADFILPDVPCISLLVSDKDTTAQVVKNALDRYGLREDSSKFGLVQVMVPTFGSEPHLNVELNERMLGDNEHPHHVYSEWEAGSHRGTATQFQLRRRSTFLRTQRESRSRSMSPEDDPSVPSLVEIFQGAQSPPQSPRKFGLSLELTEIGSNVALLDKSYICLTSNGIKPRHCVISSVNGIFTISPLDKTALITVNGKFIKEPNFLPHNAEIKLGDREMFRFFAPVENKLFTSSMHTLPSHRPSSSRGAVSPPRQERMTSLPRTENISKAFSVEDMCSPGFTSSRFDGRLKDRAFSEHNLKVDDRSSSGYGSGRVQRKLSEPNFLEEGYLVGNRSKHGGSDSHFGTFPSSNKKRHVALSAAGDKGHEGVESDWVLPASLSFYQAQETRILQLMISEVNGYLLTFKLAPACGLYMVLRHHLSPEYSTTERRKCLTLTIKHIIMQFKKSIKESRTVAGALAFWMANCSEFLHLIGQDPQLAAISGEFSTSLSQVMHTAFKCFTSCMTRELGLFLPAIYDESLEADSEEGYISGGESTISGGTGKELDSLNRSSLSRPTSLTGMYWSVAGSKVRRRGRPTIGDVLTTLSSTVSLLKRCRVNAMLSVMIFSQLFRYISAKLFNKLLNDSKLCTRAMAGKMKRRLERVREWAEKEGMELPAQDHLCLIMEALHLLQSVKKLPEDAPHLFTHVSKLNSHQMHTLLRHCSMADNDQTVNTAFAEQLVRFAQIDEGLASEGVELEVDPNPDLPFLVPQRGYFTNSLRGVPPGLHEFLEPLVSSGLCKLVLATKEENPQGVWVPPEREVLSPTYSGSLSNIQSLSGHPLGSSKTLPAFQSSNRLAAVPTSVEDVVMVRVNIKKDTHSLGISIIGGKSSSMHGDTCIGIFVKSMVEGGAAHVDGRIQPGDQLLAVDGRSLDGCKQEEAAQILRSTGKVVNLTVAKQTAMLCGVSHLIGHPSPRYPRKLDRLNDASSHARKALKKQKREQRERQLQERLQQRDFKLERRKPPPSDLPHRPQELYPSHSMPPTDSRPPPHSNPQFAKWIMEQNPRYYYSEMGSEVDLRSSMSSLANIPERDHPVNTEQSYFDSTARYNYEQSVYRPGTPPQRDSSPSKMPEQPFTTFGSSVTIDTRHVPDSHAKFNERMTLEADTHMPSVPNPQLTSSGRYKDAFSSISSQLTMESQPFSQQAASSQQQHQHLDKLSMDVMHHTQLSGVSIQGITSLIPKHRGGSTAGEGQLDRRGLKKLEAEFKMDMDDIDLEKQRIQFMFHEQQKQKELQEMAALANAPSSKVIPVSEDDEEIEDNHDEPLPWEHVRQELESLEDMVSAQRKKYREIKFSREREELKLKEIEMKFREQEMASGAFVLNSGDQKRWQSDKRRLSKELDRLKNDQNDAIQKIQNSERRAKTKLKAYETQASELQQQLNISTPAAPSPNMAMKNGYESSDTVPSKLTSDYKQGPGVSGYHDVDVRAHSEMKWMDAPTANRGFTNTMSIDDNIFEPPDLAREPMNTISASCLTEPTQDEPSRWSGYKSSTIDTALFPPGNPRDTEDTFNRRGESSNIHRGFRAISMDHIEGSQSVPSREVLEGRKDRLPIRRGASLNPNQPERKEDRSSPTKVPIYAIPERSEPVQPTYDIPTRHQHMTFMQPTQTQPAGRYSRHNRSRGVQYTKVLLQPTSDSHMTDSSKKEPLGDDIGAPDVVPASYMSPLPAHIPSRPNERNHSPGSRSSPQQPSPQPADPYYAVPVPAYIERAHPPTNTSSLPRQSSELKSPVMQQTSRPALEGAANGGRNSPSVYDQPKGSPSIRPNSALSSRTAVYDVPAAAHKQWNSPSPYESRQPDAHARVNNIKPKPNAGHRYGIMKPHSYSRSRPDSVQQQQPVNLDNVKVYMDRAYKNPGPRHPPERVQRQQTEL